MDKNLLNKKFIENNPIEEMSAFHIGYMLITEPELRQAAIDEVKESLSEEHIQRIAEQEKLVDEAEDATSVANLFRKKLAPQVQMKVLKKALAREEEMVPLLIKRLTTTVQDVFIERMTLFFASTEGDYCQALLEVYDEMRSDYAKGMVCVVLGIRGQEDVIPKIYSEYLRMVDLEDSMDFDEEDEEDEEEDEDEMFCSEGPLLALHVLYKRFNRKKK